MATEPASATEDRCSSLVEVIFCCAIKSMDPSVQKYGAKCSKVWNKVFESVDPGVQEYGSERLKVWVQMFKSLILCV